MLLKANNYNKHYLFLCLTIILLNYLSNSQPEEIINNISKNFFQYLFDQIVKYIEIKSQQVQQKGSFFNLFQPKQHFDALKFIYFQYKTIQVQNKLAFQKNMKLSTYYYIQQLKQDWNFQQLQKELQFEIQASSQNYPQYLKMLQKIQDHKKIQKLLKYFSIKTLENYQIYYGSNHYQSADIFDIIGDIQKSQDHFPKAIKFYQKSLSIKVQKYGATKIINRYKVCQNLQCLNTLNNIGLFYYSIGSSQIALEFFKYEKSILDYHHISLTKDYSLVLDNIGITLQSLGQSNSAVHYFSQALTILEMLNLTSSLDYANVNNHLGLTFLSLNITRIEQVRSDNICQLFKKSIEIAKIKKGQKAIEISYFLNGLGNCLFKKGIYQNASDHFEKSLKMRQQYYGRNHSSTITVLINLAQVKYHQRKFNETFKLIETAKLIVENLKKSNFNHPLYSVVYSNSEHYKLMLGKNRQALKQYKTAFIHNLGKNQFYTGFFYIKMGNCYHKMSEQLNQRFAQQCFYFKEQLENFYNLRGFLNFIKAKNIFRLLYWQSDINNRQKKQFLKIYEQECKNYLNTVIIKFQNKKDQLLKLMNYQSQVKQFQQQNAFQID